MTAGLDNLKHIVVLMMENRSFDHMLGFAATPTWQIDGLTGQEKNRDSTGEFAQVSNEARFSGDFTPDPGHALFDTLTQLYGDAGAPTSQNPTMNGFVLSYEGKTHNPDNAHRIMRCFSPDKVPVLTTLARQFAVCDRWFSSVPGPTFPNRAYAHGASSIGRVDMNVDWHAMSKTIYELLAENNADARIYYHDSTMAMTFKGLMNQKRYFSLFDDFLSDCAHNRLPAYTFNAIWKNQALRESTLLVVVYDEHGGLYDHVPPPPAVNPDNLDWAGSSNSLDPAFDFTRLGVRVPAVLISPYIAAGTIDHTLYDHSSIIATACKLLLKNVAGASLTKRDKNANTFENNLTLATPRHDNINFTLTAAANQSLTALGQAHLHASHLNADINDHLAAHVEAASLLEQRILPPDQHSGVDPSNIRSEKQASDFLLSVHNKLLAQAKVQTGAAGAGKGN